MHRSNKLECKKSYYYHHLSYSTLKYNRRPLFFTEFDYEYSLSLYYRVRSSQPCTRHEAAYSHATKVTQSWYHYM